MVRAMVKAAVPITKITMMTQCLPSPNLILLETLDVMAKFPFEPKKHGMSISMVLVNSYLDTSIIPGFIDG